MSPLTHMERYIAGLPNGLASYEGYTMKCGVVRQYLNIVPQLVQEAHRLPPALADLVRSPPPVSTWIPEALGNAMLLAGGDVRGCDQEQFVELSYQMNSQTMRGPLYRVMMMLASPALILRQAESRWGTFHRGVKLRVQARPDQHSADMQMIYPVNLLTERLATAYTSAFRAALEASGGKTVRFALKECSSTMASFEGSWR